MITIYTDRLIPERFGAVNFGPISLIRPKYKQDAGLHAHEEAHFTQWLTLAALGPVSAGVAYVADTPCTGDFYEGALYMLDNPAVLHAAVTQDYAARWADLVPPTLEECHAFCAAVVLPVEPEVLEVIE